MSAHAPTPWKVERHRNSLSHGEDDPNHGTPLADTHPAVQGMRCTDWLYNANPKEAEANAAHIVHCVNTYDALVTALRDLLADIGTGLVIDAYYAKDSSSGDLGTDTRIKNAEMALLNAEEK